MKNFENKQKATRQACDDNIAIGFWHNYWKQKNGDKKTPILCKSKQQEDIMKYIFFAIILMAVQLNATEMKTKTNQLIIRDAIQDMNLNKHYKSQDAKLNQRSKRMALLFQIQNRQHSCEEKCQSLCNENGSNGSGACWEQCSKEGYSSSTCASRCGISTSAGSKACWRQCSKEGYSSSTCSERCKVDSDGGSSACWEYCSKEGYSSSTCIDRCGISTPGGTAACWSHCSKEGYSSSTCASRCGVN